MQENIITLDVAGNVMSETIREVTDEEVLRHQQDIIDSKKSLVRLTRYDYLLALDKLRINILTDEIKATDAEKEELKQYRLYLLSLPESVTMDTNVEELFASTPDILKSNFPVV